MTNSASPENLLQPENDGLTTRESGAWVAEKLHYVRRYIDMFTTSMRHRPWRSRRYIDLFAGPGKCRIRETDVIVLGSPLLAVTTDYPFTDYIFVESDAENIAALKRRCEAASLPSYIEYLTGDANRLAHSVADEIIQGDSRYLPGQWWSLNLAFLDPEGLELEWSTVATLARVERMDLIFHYPQSGLTRNLESFIDSDEDTIVDRFFGDKGWRERYGELREQGASFARIHRHLIDYYKSKLADLGYVNFFDQEFSAEPLIRNTRRNAPLYRLLFASKHELGHKFWNEVTRRNVYGQPRLL